jgi:hypothetical protein
MSFRPLIEVAPGLASLAYAPPRLIIRMNPRPPRCCCVRANTLLSGPCQHDIPGGSGRFASRSSPVRSRLARLEKRPARRGPFGPSIDAASARPVARECATIARTAIPDAATGRVWDCDSESGASMRSRVGRDGFDPLHGFLDQGSPSVQGSGIARSSFASHARQTGRLEAGGKGDESDRMGAVLAMVVRDLARPWTKQRRKRRPTLTTSTLPRVLQTTSEKSK